MEMLKKIIKSVYAVEGRKKLRRREIELILQFKLSWFDPQTSKKVVDAAVQNSILTVEGEYFIPSENVMQIEVEPDFTPPKDFDPESLNVNPLEELIRHITTTVSVPKQEVVAMANRYKAEWRISSETAFIIAGYELGVDMGRFVDAAYSRLLARGV
ncbi:MAG: DUF2240 family protein [Thermoplasmata archaeon]|nr:DUF2240 family protein [Thermoplasmata archaeon]